MASSKSEAKLKNTETVEGEKISEPNKESTKSVNKIKDVSEPEKAQKKESAGFEITGKKAKKQKEKKDEPNKIGEALDFGSVSGTETKYEGKWLRFVDIKYTDPKGKKRNWEAVQRTTPAADGCDAV